MARRDADQATGHATVYGISIVPVNCGTTGGAAGRSRKKWWPPVILMFLAIQATILIPSFIYKSQNQFILIGYASISGAISFHLFTNGFSLFSMGVSLRSKRIMLFSQEIIDSAILAVSGTGFLLTSAFLWIIGQGAVFRTIGDALQGGLADLVPVMYFLAAIDSRWGVLINVARLLAFVGNLLLLWSLYRHSHCSRWYVEVNDVLEERLRDNRPWSHLT